MKTICRKLELIGDKSSEGKALHVLSALLRDLAAQVNLDGAGLYVANAGEYLRLTKWPPSSFRDFGPAEFIASAHYLLAPALAKNIKDCPVALTYSDETLAFSHALERAAIDLKRGKIKRAVILAAIMSYPIGSDISEDQQIGAAISSTDAGELAGLAEKFQTEKSRSELIGAMMNMLAKESP